jgi:exosortase D (VPLPA-CTERM-specific)
METWLESPEHGHGLLIPFLVGYILWDTRGQLFSRPFTPSWLGVGLLLFAQILLIAAVLADIEKAKAYSLILAITALLLAVAGADFTRRCTFLLLLLLMAVPLPYLLDKLLTARMQLISTDIGVAMIRTMGFPVLQEGNVINMGSFKMLVAEACSGLRYLYSLLCVGAVLAYLFRAPAWAKLMVLVATIPITIFTNSFRIAVTGLIIDRYGAEAAKGFLHAFEGWVVFVFAIALLLIWIWFLNFLLPNKRRLIQSFHLGSGIGQAHFGLWAKIPAPVVFFFMVLLFGSMASIYARLGLVPVHPERESFNHLPYVINGRGLQRSELSIEVVEVLKPDDYFLGDYVMSGGKPINLFIAYYANQRDGAVVHSPRDCLPAGGWVIESMDEVDLPNLVGHANRAVITKGAERHLVYYWVQQQGRSYADELTARAALLMRSIVDRRTDAGLVRVIIPVGDSIEASEQALNGFVMTLNQSLHRFLP